MDMADAEDYPCYPTFCIVIRNTEASLKIANSINTYSSTIFRTRYNQYISNRDRDIFSIKWSMSQIIAYVRNMSSQVFILVRRRNHRANRRAHTPSNNIAPSGPWRRGEYLLDSLLALNRTWKWIYSGVCLPSINPIRRSRLWPQSPLLPSLLTISKTLSRVSIVKERTRLSLKKDLELFVALSGLWLTRKQRLGRFDDDVRNTKQFDI